MNSDKVLVAMVENQTRLFQDETATEEERVKAFELIKAYQDIKKRQGGK